MKFYQTINYFIPIYILTFYSDIDTFTCSRYVGYTYCSPVIVHLTAKCCIHSTPVYRSRLGRIHYGTNTHLRSSYSRSEYLFRTRSVATSLVTSHQNHSNLQCYHDVLRRSFSKRFCGHSIRSSQWHGNEKC